MLNGMKILPHWISENEAAQILSKLNGWKSCITKKSRATIQYGAEYDFEQRCLKPGLVIPAWLNKICLRLHDEKLFFTKPDQVIANDYTQHMSGIAAHIDHPDCFGPIIASLSLLNPTVMQFRLGSKCSPALSVILEPCSLLVLEGEARKIWLHEISESDDSSFGLVVPKLPRISITFRNLEANHESSVIVSNMAARTELRKLV